MAINNKKTKLFHLNLWCILLSVAFTL